MPPLTPSLETRMPDFDRVETIFLTKLGFVSRLTANNGLVVRTPAASLTATVTTICSAVGNRVSLINCDIPPKQQKI
jgi:hypothetical protein